MFLIIYVDQKNSTKQAIQQIEIWNFAWLYWKILLVQPN